MEAKKCLVKPAVQEYDRYETYAAEWVETWTPEDTKDLVKQVVVACAGAVVTVALASCT